jgi:hypothetical protein
VPTNDFWDMGVHHIATLMLEVVSYHAGYGVLPSSRSQAPLATTTFMLEAASYMRGTVRFWTEFGTHSRIPLWLNDGAGVEASIHVTSSV